VHADTWHLSGQVIGGPKPPPMADWPYAAQGQLQSSFAAAAAQQPVQQHRGPPQVCGGGAVPVLLTSFCKNLVIAGP